MNYNSGHYLSHDQEAKAVALSIPVTVILVIVDVIKAHKDLNKATKLLRKTLIRARIVLRRPLGSSRASSRPQEYSGCGSLLKTT